MTVVHKDIALLSQKASVAGTEKIPVSDTEYVTTSQLKDTAVASSQPAGGMLPNVEYDLGTLTGSVTIAFASASNNSIVNEYMFTFDADSTAPTITFPNSVTSWQGNCLNNGAPAISASKHYEVSVIGAYGIIVEF